MLPQILKSLSISQILSPEIQAHSEKVGNNVGSDCAFRVARSIASLTSLLQAFCWKGLKLFLSLTCPNIKKKIKYLRHWNTFGLNGTNSFSFWLICFIFTVILTTSIRSGAKVFLLVCMVPWVVGTVLTVLLGVLIYILTLSQPAIDLSYLNQKWLDHLWCWALEYG